MSRRKLGSRPQHLSSIQDAPQTCDFATSMLLEGAEQVEGETRDLLTCGQCGVAFPLAQILVFIQHKQGDCSGPGSSLQAQTPPSPAPCALTHVTSPANGRTGAGNVELRRMMDRGFRGELDMKTARHITVMEEPSCFTCQLCACVYPSAWALLQHAQITHGLSIYQEEGSEGHQPSPPATPEPCHPSTTLASLALPHLKHSSSSSSCSPEPQNFSFPLHLQELAEDNDAVSSPSPPTAAPAPPAASRQTGYSCELCGEFLQSLGSLAAHRLTHAGERPYCCGLCGKAFAKSSQLTSHMNSHWRSRAWARPGGEDEEEELVLKARLFQEMPVGKQGSGEVLLSSRRPASRQPPGGRKGLLGLFQPQGKGGEGEAAEEPSSCSSPFEGSLESEETTGSGESGIASGDCTPKWQEREERLSEREAEREWQQEVA
ncbi:hypothetical protein MATL_G00043520, partial [Megalops atlanticus]